MADANASPPGLFASLRRLLGSAAELLEVRLALFATELQQEKLRALDALALLALALLTAGVALVLLSLFVVMLFAETYRVAALGAVVLVYALAAVLLWRAARSRLARGTPFEATRAELRRDREALAGRDPGASP